MRQRPNVRALLATLAIVALLGACGGDSDSETSEDTPSTAAPASSATATPPPTGSTVTGPGGDVTVALPSGSAISGGSVQFNPLPVDQWPSELSAVDAQVVMEIGPDGTQFVEPVTVTLKLAAAVVTDLSGVFLITRSADGTWESLDNVGAKLEGDSVLVSGATTHFSPFAAGIAPPDTVAHQQVNEASAANAALLPAPDNEAQPLPPLPGLPPPKDAIPQDVLAGYEQMFEAVENQDPQLLIDSTEPGPERDNALAVYTFIALDTSVLDLIEDPRVHDGTFIYMASVAYGRLGLAPVKDYCDHLRGGYEYNDISSDSSTLPDEELIDNRVLCNQTVAAMNELAHGGDDCDSHVEATFESEYAQDDPFYAEDKQSTKDNCRAMVSAMRDLEARIENAETPEELLEIVKEIEHATADDGSASCDYSGVYATNWGEMTIRHAGSSITADYTHDAGRLDGSLNGNILSGRWYEAPSYAGPGDAGPLEFTFEEDCASFTGVWAYDSTTSGWAGDWAGGNTKVRSVPLPDTPLGDPDSANLGDDFSGGAAGD